MLHQAMVILMTLIQKMEHLVAMIRLSLRRYLQHMLQKKYLMLL